MSFRTNVRNLKVLVRKISKLLLKIPGKLPHVSSGQDSE